MKIDEFQKQYQLDELSEMFVLYFDNHDSFLNFDEINHIVEKKAYEYLTSHKRSPKVLSKRNLNRLAKQWFFEHYPDKKTYICYNVKVKKKGKRITDEAQFYTLNYLSTPKGTVYFHKYPDMHGRNNLTSFFAHFFDRLNQRAFDSELSRVEAIQKWFSLNNHAFIINRFKGDPTRMSFFTDEGMVLGNIVYIDNKMALSFEDSPNKIVFTTYNTFVSNKQLTKVQKSIRDKNFSRLEAEEQMFAEASEWFKGLTDKQKKMILDDVGTNYDNKLFKRS